MSSFKTTCVNTMSIDLGNDDGTIMRDYRRLQEMLFLFRIFKFFNITDAQQVFLKINKQYVLRKYSNNKLVLKFSKKFQNVIITLDYIKFPTHIQLFKHLVRISLSNMNTNELHILKSVEVLLSLCCIQSLNFISISFTAYASNS